MKTIRSTFAIATLTVAALLIYGCCGSSSSSTIDVEPPEVAPADTSGGGGGALKSCNDHGSLSTCSTYDAKAFTILGEDFFKSICELVEGTWGTAPCPTENQIGTCDDGEGILTYYYNDGGDPYDVAKAETDCKETLGTFKK
jgi:hypothetical protein